MTVFSMANRCEFPPLGLLGGNDGPLREHLINGETVHPKDRHELAPGDRVTLKQPGGGGFGPPEDRPAEILASDLIDGYITERAIEEDYGR